LYRFQKIKLATKKDPYPLPFIAKVLNILIGYEAYSFLHQYSKYHQIYIAPKDKYKIAFVTDSKAFIWKVMSFGIKNGPSTYQKVVAKAFRKYLDSFMKIFWMTL